MNKDLEGKNSQQNIRNTEAEANFFKDVRITNSNRYQDDARTKRISRY